MEKTETKAEVTTEDMARFSKQQILRSKKYELYRDLLGGILKEDQQYSCKELYEIIALFQKGKVN